jgi:hypothetical protein
LIRIKKGENALINRFLKKKDETNFLRSEFSTLSVRLIQKGRVIETYTFPSTYLRAGTANNEIVIEVTTAVSNKFSAGKVVAEYTFTVPDFDFAEDDSYVDIISEEVLDVEKTP